MTEHLHEDEFSSILAGIPRQEWLRHLENCAECEQRLDSEKLRLHRIREAIFMAASHPETYWAAQHARILSRTNEPDPRHGLTIWKFAVCALALAVFALVLLRSHSLQPARALQSQADEQLLMEVEQEADSDLPDAMAPANVLAEDMESQANMLESGAHLQKASAGGHR